MFSFKDKTTTQSTAGLSLSDEGISLVITEYQQGKPVLTHAGFYACSPSEYSQQLSLLSKEHQLDSIPCNLVLTPEDYQVIQIDAPEVPKQELATALRWQVKDLISFHIDDVVIEHTEMDNEQTSGKPQILVFICRKSLVEDYVELMRVAQCKLNAIDTAVFAIRNLVAHMKSIDNTDSIGILNLYKAYSRITVLLNNDIIINRASSIGLNELAFMSSDAGSMIIDNTALEIQRTFDYYERHSRQSPISDLVIFNNGDDIESLDLLLNKRLGINCHLFSFEGVIDNKTAVDIPNSCISAVGGALRMEHA